MFSFNKEKVLVHIVEILFARLWRFHWGDFKEQHSLISSNIRLSFDNFPKKKKKRLLNLFIYLLSIYETSMYIQLYKNFKTKSVTKKIEEMWRKYQYHTRWCKGIVTVSRVSRSNIITRVLRAPIY